MEQVQGTNNASKVVARGQLDKFNTAAVLQALSISRQFTAVDFYRSDGSLAGRVLLKSGMVLAAQLAGGDVQNMQALQILLHEPLDAFQVERLAPQDEYPTPIAQLSTGVLSSLPRPSAAAPTGAPEPTAPGAAPARGTDPATPPAPAAATRPTPAPQPTGVSDRATPVVAVASPKGGCGKTTLALNLAVSLARAGKRVTLVDTDPNGDILSAVGGRDRVRAGIFDAIAAGGDPAAPAIRTAVEGLVLLPALGPGTDLPASLVSSPPDHRVWSDLFRRLAANADVVVVDTAAGMLGASAQVMSACSHVLGVLQAETISQRSFGMFDRALAALDGSPEVLGVVLNMVRRSNQASLSVLIDASTRMPEDRLFQVSIPRSDLFLELSAQGAPVAYAERDATGVGVLLDTLAAEVAARLGIDERAARARPASFLM
ncbi:MAG: ParA family protein [Myxococcota bacterium]|nr:ParA family protein [Myxococcota bacterium]